ncbi:hypothetical protein ACLOJK_021344 [Asimina triloba]
MIWEFVFEQEQEIKEHEVTVLQLKSGGPVSEEREKAAEALVADCKEHLVLLLANELTVLRAPSQGSSKKRRSEALEGSNSQQQKTKGVTDSLAGIWKMVGTRSIPTTCVARGIHPANFSTGRVLTDALKQNQSMRRTSHVMYDASLELADHQFLLQIPDNDMLDERIRYAAIEEEDEKDGHRREEELEEEEEEEEKQSFLSVNIDKLRREGDERRRNEAVNPEWVFSLQRKLLMEPRIEKKSSGINGSCSIHRVPDCFRQQGREDSYVPQIISIGPLHRNKESLQSMEEHKQKYLRDVVSRAHHDSREAPSKILERCLIKVKSLEKEARECYSEEIDLDSNEFVEMMVVDGCFVVGLLCKAAGQLHVDAGDPTFKMGWLMSKLQNDLLMLENQIPFVVLQALFVMVNAAGKIQGSLASLALDFFEGLLPRIEKAKKEVPAIGCQHLLHLFHSSLLPTAEEEKKRKRKRKRLVCFQANVKEEKEKQMETAGFNLIHSVTALKESGIKFKKAKGAESFFDVRFRNGVMEIPAIVIHGATNSLFLNLIALEQCYSHCSDHFTAYTAFMNCLINTATDVGSLRRSGIVENWLGSDEEVAHLVKNLGREVAISTDGFYLSRVFTEVHHYCRTDWNTWKASLKRDYFSNPWAILSFAAAILLLLLTFLQTFFAILLKHRSGLDGLGSPITSLQGSTSTKTEPYKSCFGSWKSGAIGNNVGIEGYASCELSCDSLGFCQKYTRCRSGGAKAAVWATLGRRLIIHAVFHFSLSMNAQINLHRPCQSSESIFEDSENLCGLWLIAGREWRMGGGREVQISLDGVRDKNVMQLKKLNTALFPVRYNDKYYADALSSGDFTKLVYFRLKRFALDQLLGAMRVSIYPNNVVDRCLVYVFPAAVVEKVKNIASLFASKQPSNVFPSPFLSQALAYYSDICVGSIACRLEKKEAGAIRVYIMTLGVLAPYRGLGIGTKLLSHVLDLCLKQNISEIYLHVQTNNEDAINFYKKFGFEITDTIQNYYTNISPPDCYVLTKFITPAQPNK